MWIAVTGIYVKNREDNGNLCRIKFSIWKNSLMEENMINAIRDIGAYLRENNGIDESDIVRSLVNRIDGDSIKEILLINIKDDGSVDVQSEEFYGDISTKALFYQAGNGALGGGLRADYFKDEKKEIEKFDKKIRQTLLYCEVENHYDEVKEIIYKRINENNKNFFTIILKNGKYPVELFKDKFLDKMYSTIFKSVLGKHVCHFCGEAGEVFNTTTYKFYTNDKEVYGNINDKEKNGVVLCKKCLNDILIGKKYVEEKLTTFWHNKSVMFLPHNFNECTEAIYENSTVGSDNKKKFISNLYEDEKTFLDLLGKGNTETDIIFFEKDGSKTFYIYHTIKSMLPSRFGELATLLDKYKVKIFNVINFTTAVKVGLNGVESTDKEKLKIVDAVFTGRKIYRNIFFTRVMMVYKYHYINSKSLKDDYKFMINNISKVYNFLVDCGCLKGGFKVMTKYNDYKELFEDNENYFNTNEKKAWFLMGMSYNYVNYLIKKGNAGEDGKAADRSSLDKNFFFARKFDFKDFIYFSNLLSDKTIKYRINQIKLKEMLMEGKNLMANKEGKLSADEAKYIFFWGMDSYFGKDKEKINNQDEESLNEKIEA